MSWYKGKGKGKCKGSRRGKGDGSQTRPLDNQTDVWSARGRLSDQTAARDRGRPVEHPVSIGKGRQTEQASAGSSARPTEKASPNGKGRGTEQVAASGFRNQREPSVSHQRASSAPPLFPVKPSGPGPLLGLDLASPPPPPVSAYVIEHPHPAPASTLSIFQHPQRPLPPNRHFLSCSSLIR